MGLKDSQTSNLLSKATNFINKQPVLLENPLMHLLIDKVLIQLIIIPNKFLKKEFCQLQLIFVQANNSRTKQLQI